MIATSTALTSVGSNPIVFIPVAVLVFLAGRAVAKHVAAKERDPRLLNLLTISLVIHLLCAPAQIFVVDHIYNGVADYNRYLFQGTYIANNVRAGHFTLANTGVTSILGDGMVSIISGSVLTVLGPNKLAEFLVFALVAFIGDVCFYRAFSITFPEANRRRYALMAFLLPSLLFWTADISKEAIMTFALGVAAYGVARVLMRAPRGYILIIVGAAISIVIRPHELALLLVGFTIAMLFRGRDASQKMRGARRILTFVFLGLILGVTGYVTEKYLGGSTSLSTILNKVHASNNTGTGAGFGSSSVSYSANPLFYPKDIYTVLFDPLPVTAHGGSEYIAALENTVILVLVLSSLRQLASVFRVARWRPYVMACLIYSASFLYVFAALGNLGLIERERVLLLPLFFVLLCIPLSPKGKPPSYPWERRRIRRRDRASAAALNGTPLNGAHRTTPK
jgi:hypothetical protein